MQLFRRSRYTLVRLRTTTFSGLVHKYGTKAGVLSDDELLALCDYSYSGWSHRLHDSIGYLAASLAVASLVGCSNTAKSQAHANNSSQDPANDSSGFMLMDLNHRRRAFFKYERRLREMSPPGKVFEYFASRSDGRTDYAMTPSDVMRSVIAVYPPANSQIVRAGSLPGEPNPKVSQEPSAFFDAFDIDASGGITFDEWLLVEALLLIPPDEVEVAFALMDANGDGKIDYSEFHDVLRAIRHRASSGLGRSTSYHAQTATTVALPDAQAGLISQFFGKDQKRTLRLPEFQAFIEALRKEMVRLEFAWYDFENNGAITARDFALSVVGCARLKHVDYYLTKIDGMPSDLASKQLTLDEFQAFRKAWRGLRRLSVALEFYSHSSDQDIAPAEFGRVARSVLGISLAPTAIETLFYLFGKAGDHNELNTEFMYCVMDRHYEAGGVLHRQVTDGGAGGQGARAGTGFWECVSKCMAR